MSTQTYRLLNLLLLAAFYAGSLMVYPTLPDRIPIHFDLAGRPDAWEDRSILAWLMLPILATGIAGLMALAPRLSASNPHLWNVPEKKRFLALTPEARAPIIQLLEQFLAFTGVMTTGLMMVVQAAAYHAATRAGGSPVLMLAAIVPMIALIVGRGLRMNARIHTLIREAYAREVPS